MRSNSETNDRYRPMGLDPNIGIVISWWCLPGCTIHRRNCISPQRMYSLLKVHGPGETCPYVEMEDGGLRPEMLESRAINLL